MQHQVLLVSSYQITAKTIATLLNTNHTLKEITDGEESLNDLDITPTLLNQYFEDFNLYHDFVAYYRVPSLL
jgi:hypothetical protein